MREKILFDDKWHFHKGDLSDDFPSQKGLTYTQSKTERKIWGPASMHYNSTPDYYYYGNGSTHTDRWEWVNLPHDYIISQTPDEKENNALGFFKYENAWYRKLFQLGEEDKDKRITLLFEGIATHATIYLNGCLMKHNFCGYNSFEVNITDVVRFGEENVLAVYVQTHEHEGWWYEGGGIYRHVWLVKTADVAVDLWGVYVKSEKIAPGIRNEETETTDSNIWNVETETMVINDRYSETEVFCETKIYDKDKCLVAKQSQKATLPYREKTTITTRMTVSDPLLWDIETPDLYDVETSLYVKDELVDTYHTSTGFRTIAFDLEEGLFLNGRHIKLQGVCAHQDFGLTGKAVPDNVAQYKIRLIKEMGANAYRTSHYPHSEATMDAIDRMGLLVMDETRWFESTEEGKQQLEMLVRRDRNRPSILFWSIGNEEPHHITETGRRICKNLMAMIKKLDSTRPVMSAVSNSPDQATVYDELDAIGINYNLDQFDAIHKAYPEKPVFSSECCATGTTRGWYFDDCPEKGFLSAYDKDTNAWFLGREKTWKFMCERKWVLGAFQWIAFEHRGESVWPRLCSQSGAIDLYLQKKDAFYQNQSHWLNPQTHPMVHILPHWNRKGMEGEEIRVFVYTNCDEVELYLNNKSLGRKTIERYGHGTWTVPYQPGELCAVAYHAGKEVSRDTVTTSGKALALKLRLENEVHANGRDIAVITCYCVDADGREVPDATPLVEFHANALGRIVGTGSDISDHTPVTATSRRMRAGRITVACQVGSAPGSLKVYAVAENLEMGVVEILL